MTDRNPITGDALLSKVNTKEYDDNYDRIFRNENRVRDVDIEDATNQPLQRELPLQVSDK